jgi:hypothetical protein
MNLKTKKQKRSGVGRKKLLERKVEEKAKPVRRKKKWNK